MEKDEIPRTAPASELQTEARESRKRPKDIWRRTVEKELHKQSSRSWVKAWHYQGANFPPASFAIKTCDQARFQFS